MEFLNRKYFIINGRKVPFISGGKGGCFIAGTKISVPTGCGEKNIEDIQVGDLVLSFNAVGTISINKVTEIFQHKNQEVIKVTFWDDSYIYVTPNHWFLTEDNDFLEIGHFKVDDAVIKKSGHITTVKTIEQLSELYTTYNFTVENNHSYIANNIRVHNKGGGKGGGAEADNTLFSKDTLFVTLALGEGPVYRILPNGPQDIEVNEGNIDDLINIDTDGTVKTEIFNYSATGGTLTQDPLPVFGEETITPQVLSYPVVLKKGNISGIPEAKVYLQSTSANDWDAIRFNFRINGLQQMDNSGNINPYSVSIKISIYDTTGLITIGEIEKTIQGKTNTPYGFQIYFPIPTDYLNENGYKFTVEKTSDDSDSSKIQDVVVFIGWDEISNDAHSYPRTAIIGYALEAHSEHQGTIPVFTQLIKGLLCKVPSNYNQPILSNGDIDWRQLELPETGTYGYTTNGYRLQKTGATILYDANPVIYQGLWDGSFVYAWTQNPVWIIYDLLTSKTYGLGLPEKYIDKYKFYNIAQYCDGIDTVTGKWYGVSGYADGTFRHKPLDMFTEVREVLIGINEGISINERRFTCDVTIASQTQVMDIINKLTALFRGLLYYSGGKITINADLPDQLPVAVFNEGNIQKDSLVISGVKEDELLTGVEVAYVEPSNHYRREVIRVDDPTALKELNEIENIMSVDLSGCTRRSQAIRFAQYLLASSKYIRRRVDFKTTVEAINLTVGDVIAVSQKTVGVNWGYGGRVASNSTIATSNVVLEHFTSPALSNSVFTANTLPLALRIINTQTDRIDLYMLSNNYTTYTSGNAHQGIDLIEVEIAQRFKPTTKTWSSDNLFKANNVPVKYDLWTLGEINPSNYYSNQGEKLYKILNLERDNEETISISASEYISNVYSDSDTLINYVPVKYKETFSALIPPPPPFLGLRSYPIRNADGSISYNLDINAYTDKSAYPITIETEFEYAKPDQILTVEGIS